VIAAAFFGLMLSALALALFAFSARPDKTPSMWVRSNEPLEAITADSEEQGKLP